VDSDDTDGGSDDDDQPFPDEEDAEDVVMDDGDDTEMTDGTTKIVRPPLGPPKDPGGKQYFISFAIVSYSNVYLYSCKRSA
jgi:hypothetical protein